MGTGLGEQIATGTSRLEEGKGTPVKRGTEHKALTNDLNILK